ncbi:tellurite resistance TerB family protein [Roseovarius salinarum]|uniref:tellurite resistance TerB family protein n=1 Tax=Roseovarius salinarum TaxID=1981892 RepID=UPI000C34877B|nr:TerB family tellurite resistance protein [Roseovarius salinarum]
MLTRILDALKRPSPAPLPEPDERLALGALMVRVAKSDSDYQLAEISRIDRLLSRLYALGPVEAAKMRATCEKLDRAAPDTAHFAHLIRESVSFEARVDALEALWEVTLADGVRDEAELSVMHAAQEALGLSETDSAAARTRAESG